MYTVSFLSNAGFCRGTLYFNSLAEFFGGCLSLRELVPCIRALNPAGEKVLELTAGKLTFAATPHLLRWATEAVLRFSVLDCTNSFEVIFDAYRASRASYLAGGQALDLRDADYLLLAVAARDDRDLSLLPYESSDVLISRRECEGTDRV